MTARLLNFLPFFLFLLGIKMKTVCIGLLLWTITFLTDTNGQGLSLDELINQTFSKPAQDSASPTPVVPPQPKADIDPLSVSSEMFDFVWCY
jgi:hypothetical protein